MDPDDNYNNIIFFSFSFFFWEGGGGGVGYKFITIIRLIYCLSPQENTLGHIICDLIVEVNITII